MALIVQKFGGSSVADAAKIQNVSNIITRTYDAGNDVVVVLSAQGDTTDDLIEKAMEINPDASKREMDVLLSTGEQISIALAAMCIEKMGYPVISLTGWQVGMETSSDYSRARIRKVEGSRIRKELDKHRIVLVAGFQGINRYGDITTLGRGGSDTTAVALAVALKADLCQIYTDVDGVYTADPRIVPNAKKLDAITYDEMLELASLGAQVLHNRSVELAKRYQIELEVLSSFTGNPGTIVKEGVKMEKQITDSLERYKEIAKKVRLKNRELEVLSELAHSVENMRNNYVSKKGKYEFSRGMNEVNGIIIIPQLDKALEEFRELRVQLDEEEKRFKNIAKFHGFNLDTNIINFHKEVE